MKKISDLKQFIACFYANVMSALLFAVAMANNWLPAMVLFFLLLVLCLMWSERLFRRMADKEYKRHRSDSKAINDLTKEVEKLKTELSLKADKPAKSNIRPGSRPGEQYYAMIGRKEEEKDDHRAKNPSAS